MKERRTDMEINVNGEKSTVELLKYYNVQLKNDVAVSKTSTVGGDAFIARAIGFGFRKKTITFRTSLSQPYFTIYAKDIEWIEEWVERT